MASSGSWDKYTQTTKDTVPASTAGSGTVTTNGRVVTVDAGQAAVAQVMTTTLTGTYGSGTVDISAAGGATVTFGITFVTSLAKTAKSFVRTSGSIIRAMGIDVVASGATIVFTSQTPGTAITVSATLTNVSGDFGGTTATTTANATGLNFKDLPEGAWFYSPDESEVRKIESINSETSLTLESALSSDIAAKTFRYVMGSGTSGAFPREMSLTNTHASASATIDADFTLIATATVTQGEDMIANGSTRDRVDPVVLDAVGSSVMVTLIY